MCLFCWKCKDMSKEDGIESWLALLFKTMTILNIMVCPLYSSGMMKAIKSFFTFMDFSLHC